MPTLDVASNVIFSERHTLVNGRIDQSEWLSDWWVKGCKPEVISGVGYEFTLRHLPPQKKGSFSLVSNVQLGQFSLGYSCVFSVQV
jgi:hypothetical protein